MIDHRDPRKSSLTVFSYVLRFPFSAFLALHNCLYRSVLLLGKYLNFGRVLSYPGDFVEREQMDPKVRELLEKDPVAFFHGLADLYLSGQDPKELGIVPGNPVTKKVKDATRWASQQVDNAKAASSDWLDGVKNPSRDPIEAAKAAKDKFVDRLNQAIKAGKWEKGLAKSSAAEIVEIATAVGTSHYETGVEARRKKVARVVNELQPLAQAVSDTIQAMPDKTDADREKRLTSARKLMLEVGEKRRK